jgi:hypothetical protein
MAWLATFLRGGTPAKSSSLHCLHLILLYNYRRKPTSLVTMQSNDMIISRSLVVIRIHYCAQVIKLLLVGPANRGMRSWARTTRGAES